MPQLDDTLLTWITFTPTIGVVLIGLLLCLQPLLRLSKQVKDQASRAIALIASAISLVLCVLLWTRFDSSNTGIQMVHRFPWIESFDIEFFFGIDGLSITMVLLTGLISFVAVIASLPWGIAKDDTKHFSRKSVSGYMALLLLLQTGMYGVFCSLDFFLFYIFWEIMLLPMYFLIGIWGGPRKEYAAIKFFLYTLAGSVLMLLAMIWLYMKTGTFDLIKLAELGRQGFFTNFVLLGIEAQKLIFIGLFIGFAIKIPMFPFHTWLPDAHVEAPTPISVILAGVLLKMGVYGILRINFGVLPQATEWARYGIAIFGVINIVYAAFVCMAQKDLKRLIAYSSVSHMGFCLLAMAAFTDQGITGAVYQMWCHGIISPALFLIAGVIYDRAHHRDIEGFGGLAKQMPEYTALMGIAFMASLGLPGLCGFVAEALCFLGAFPVDHTFNVLTIIAALGVIITAAYYLWTIQRMFLGPLNEKYSKLPDVNWRERLVLYPLTAIIIVLGFYPMPILDLINPKLHAMVEPLREIANQAASIVGM